jgi:hypothetical protein
MSKSTEPYAARLRITLLDLDPASWREVEVPLSMSFKGLHDAIQAAFLWFDYHLWEFEFDGRRYGIPFDDDDIFGGEKTFKADGARLTNLRTSGVTEFLYVYDMGDNWEHHIELVKLFKADPKTRLPRFVDGKTRRPPEDVGGVPGFEMFLEALSDPDHEEHQHLLDWHGGPFDPDDIDKAGIRVQMKRLANRRKSRK